MYSTYSSTRERELNKPLLITSLGHWTLIIKNLSKGIPETLIYVSSHYYYLAV